MKNILNELKPQIEKYCLTHPAQMWLDFAPVLSKYRFVQCALDVAAYDLWGKLLKNKTVLQLLGLDRTKLPKSSYSIGIDSVEKSIARIRKENDWPQYKIKLGHDNDFDRLSALRKETKSPFRVDVNCGWSLKEAEQKIPRLA